MKKQNLFMLGFVILLISGLVMLSGCISEEKPTKKVTTTEKKTTNTIKETISEPTTTVKAVKETATTEQPSELNLKVGETATTSKIEVTVKSAKKVKEYEYYSDVLQQYYTRTAPPGKVFIIADVEIKNIGNSRAYVGASEFSVTDSEGYRYDPEYYLGEDRLDMVKELYQNQKMDGKVVFKVPKDAKGLKIQYDFGRFTGVKLATWEI